MSHPETVDVIVRRIMDDIRHIIEKSIELRVRQALAEQYNAGYEDRKIDDEFTDSLQLHEVK